MAAQGPAVASFERRVTLRCVTAIMSVVVGLTFLFGFGNVWALAVRLGVYRWVAPLVAPAVDLSVLGLLLATRFLALHGASREQLRPARRLLVFSSGMTLALNVVDPLIARQVGKAAFDAVGPLLLIGWAEVGPGLLQAINGGSAGSAEDPALIAEAERIGGAAADGESVDPVAGEEPRVVSGGGRPSAGDGLLERARQEDARHWAEHQRPISAETLRKRLRVGASRSRSLVAMVRADAARPGASEVERANDRVSG